MIGGSVTVAGYIAPGDIVVTHGQYLQCEPQERRSTRLLLTYSLCVGAKSQVEGYGDTAVVLAAHAGKAVSA